MIHYEQPTIEPQILKMISYFLDLQAEIIKNKSNLTEYLTNINQSDLPEELIILYNEAQNFKY